MVSNLPNNHIADERLVLKYRLLFSTVSYAYIILKNFFFLIILIFICGHAVQLVGP